MTGTPHRRALVALAVSAAVLNAVLLGGSDRAWLLAAWLPDDAFYSLLPAWNAGQGDGFTFDGRGLTYGWQPLWTLLAATVASVCPTRAVFLGVMLGTGAALHLATGAFLFRWLEGAGRATAGLAAATVWLLGPDLLRVSATGMESGLVGALLAGVLLARQRRLPAAWLGALVGLLFLARVTTLPLAVLLVALVARDRRQDGVWFLASFGLVTLPWLGFAHGHFGQALPTSGSRKLIEGLAGLATFASSTPFVGETLAASWVPERAARLVGAEGLAAPSLRSFWRLGARATAGWAWGHWLPGGVSLLDAARAVGVLLLGGAALRGRWTAGFGRPLLLLGSFALAHAAVHHLLLAGYVEYGYWYRVPELIFAVVLAGLAVEAALAGPWRQAGLVGAGLLGAIGLAASVGHARPRQGAPDADRYATGVLALEGSVNALPADAVVGSWNAGLVGWIAEGPSVVNLDGLANDRAFVRVAIDEVLFRHGLADGNPTLEYLDEAGIGYLVDIQPLDGLGTAPFYGVVPAPRYAPVARSAAITHWAGTERDHAVALVQVLPKDRAGP